MSAQNGDRARFHKNRTRKLQRRQRIQLLTAGSTEKAAGEPVAVAAKRRIKGQR
jgi:hypothetical protein